MVEISKNIYFEKNFNLLLVTEKEKKKKKRKRNVKQCVKWIHVHALFNNKYKNEFGLNRKSRNKIWRNKENE